MVSYTTNLIISDPEVEKLLQQMANRSELTSCLPGPGPKQGGLKNGQRTLKFSGRTGMQGKSRVSSAIKYDCSKLSTLGIV